MEHEVKGIIIRIGIGILVFAEYMFLMYLIMCHSPCFVLALLFVLVTSVMAYWDDDRVVFWLLLTFLMPLMCGLVVIVRNFVF